MKKIFIVAAVILTTVILFMFLNKKSSFIEYKLNGKIYKLLPAKSSSEWERGLMNYRSKKELKGADGMIFIFPNKNFRTFWNENTYLDLDIYWLNDDKVVGKSFLPSIEKSREAVTVDSLKAVNKVIEIIR
ncbi:DUF192 domain-containing protein [Candidatus Roizmanbacteria bacterium]|nr:DUF192 domain-containing protein [Candidatus Roizmanbacteria bacterium]